MLSTNHLTALRTAFGPRLSYSSVYAIWIDGIDVSDVACLATLVGGADLEYGPLDPDELVQLASERVDEELAELADRAQDASDSDEALN
jgi:hypothetical protein